MNNLIPERRVNKNGVTSIKWVKPAAPSSLVGTAIPIPVASVQEQEPMDITYEVMVIGELLYSKDDTVHTKRMIGDNLRYIAERNTDLLILVKSVASADDMGTYLLRNLIKKDGFYDTHSPISVRDPHFDPEQAMQELETALHIIPLCSRLETRFGHAEFESGTEGQMLIQSVVRTLKKEGITELGGERTVALAMVTYVQDGEEFGLGDDIVSYVEGDIDYIVEHLDEVESMLPELQARKAHEREAIALLLNAPAKAIRSGTL